MLVLDTDHVTEIERGSALGGKLRNRLEICDEHVSITIVTAEEQLRGWLAQIRRHNEPQRQIRPYARLQSRIAFYAEWRLLPWDEPSADQFERLRGQGIRIGTMDLKIASIALAFGATLLTRNLVDFSKVPGLQLDNWL